MVDALIARLLARDARALARALTLVTDEAPEAVDVLGRIHAHTGRAYRVGVTGPPGAGKSTLVDRLITEFRRAGTSVAVIAVDPSSPFSGGAILGDRVRMQAHAADAGVFIRSLATRGHLGGLSATTGDAARVMDAAGFDVVVIETVGVGQDEVEVASLSDVSIVVLVPGAGDDVQALKAGLMEIGDIFVVNKADRPGVDDAVRAIEASLALDPRGGEAWRPIVLRTVATEGTGVSELVAAVGRFRAAAGGVLTRRRQAQTERDLEVRLAREVSRRIGPATLRTAAVRIEARETDPHRAVAEMLAPVLAAAGSRVTAPVTLDHVAVATERGDAAADALERALGVVAGPPADMDDHAVQVRFVPTAGALVEIIAPVGDASPVRTFLDRRGPGLHHVAFRVRDLPGTLAALEARGVRLVDRVPRAGARGASIAFIHPSSTGGVLVELVDEESLRENR